MSEIPNWASELMNEINEVKTIQARIAAPAPLPEPPAPKLINMGFGDVPESSVPTWLLQQFAKDQAMLGAPTDIINMLENEMPDRFAGLRQHLREQQAAFASNEPTTDNEASKELARKALANRGVINDGSSFWK